MTDVKRSQEGITTMKHDSARTTEPRCDWCGMEPATVNLGGGTRVGEKCKDMSDRLSH